MGRLRRLLLAVVVFAAFGRYASTGFRGDACTAAGDDPAAQQNAVYLTTPPSRGPTSSQRALRHLVQRRPEPSDYITETKAGDVGGFAEHEYASTPQWASRRRWSTRLGQGRHRGHQPLELGLSSVVCNGPYYFDSTTVGGDGEVIFERLGRLHASPEQPRRRGGGAVAHSGDSAVGVDEGQWLSGRFRLGHRAAGDVTRLLGSTRGEGRKCSKNAVREPRPLRWPFYEYLAERFGTLFIDEMLVRSGVHNGILGLREALVAHGTTLVAAYSDLGRKRARQLDRVRARPASRRSRARRS